MQFEKQSRISHPPDVVLACMMDEMEAIVPFLANVDGIETQMFEKLDDGRVHVVRRWQGTSDSAPAAVRPFLNQELVAWTDDALWTPTDRRVDWTLSNSMSKFYGCTGSTTFEPDGGDPTKTLMRIRGDLAVSPEKLPGVPRFLGRKLAPQIEKFVVNLVTPNLTEVAKGLQGYLDEKGA